MDIIEKIKDYLNEAKIEKTYLRLNLKDPLKWIRKDNEQFMDDDSFRGYSDPKPAPNTKFEITPEFIKNNYKVRDKVKAMGAVDAYLKNLTNKDLGIKGAARAQIIIDISSEDNVIWRQYIPSAIMKLDKIWNSLVPLRWKQSKVNDLVKYFTKSDSSVNKN